MRSPPEEPHLSVRLVTFSLFLVTSDISPELLSHATGLKFQYVGVRAWGSKLAIGIVHLWSWARFMAPQILVINFPNSASWQKLWPKFEMP